MGNAVATQSNTVNLPDAVHSITRGGLVIGGNLIPDSDDQRNIGAAGSEFKDLHLDGTANIDSLIADTAQISDLTQNRLTFAGASGELSDNSAFTVNTTDSTLTATNVDVGAGITFYGHGGAAISGITTIGGALDVNSTSNFADDVVFDCDTGNITFDKTANSIIFDDDAAAKFGTDSDFTVTHSGSNANIENTTGRFNN